MARNEHTGTLKPSIHINNNVILFYSLTNKLINELELNINMNCCWTCCPLPNQLDHQNGETRSWQAPALVVLKALCYSVIHQKPHFIFPTNHILAHQGREDHCVWPDSTISFFSPTKHMYLFPSKVTVCWIPSLGSSSPVQLVVTARCASPLSPSGLQIPRQRLRWNIGFRFVPASPGGPLTARGRRAP